MTESEDTRARIAEAAHRLFTEGGEEATSLRAITRAAEVNVASVHYHFGGRDELLRVVLDRKIGPLNRHRMRLLDEAVATHGAVVPVEELLRAFIRPDLELLAELRETEVRFARFMGRAYTQPSPMVAGLVERQFQDIGDRLFPLLEKALPEVDPDELRVRMRLTVSVITNLFASAVPPGEPHPLDTDDIERQLRRLVGFLSPALAAPNPKPET